MKIRLTHVGHADLNLLPYFAALAEEGNISQAAKRMAISQPSMSRALQRLRVLFKDDLLVRGARTCELTPKGKALRTELASLLPKIDRFIAGTPFDPRSEAADFRISATDNATMLFSSALCPQSLRWERVSFHFQSWNDDVHDDLNRGRIDLLLNAQDGSLPRHLCWETVYKDEVVCVVAKEHRLDHHVTLKQYAAALHIDVLVLSDSQSFLERRLAKLGVTRRNVFTVPYFAVAMNAVAGTKLMTTVPRRLAESFINRARTKILLLPDQFSGFNYLMAWHPRLQTDVQHCWLRQTMREAAKNLPKLPP